MTLWDEKKQIGKYTYLLVTVAESWDMAFKIAKGLREIGCVVQIEIDHNGVYDTPGAYLVWARVKNPTLFEKARVTWFALTGKGLGKMKASA